MAYRDRLIGLTERDLEILCGLSAGGWLRPLDLGGTDGSHHSATLTKLARKGMAQFKQRGAINPPAGENGRRQGIFGRGSLVYRITDVGRAVYAEHCHKIEHEETS